MKRIAAAVLFAALAFAAVFSGFADALNKKAEDLLYHQAGGTTEKIKIIKIDEKSVEAMGDFTEWDRAVYGRLVDTLCVSEDIKPAVIAFDIVFGADNGNEADRYFADACAAHGSVVCAASYVFERQVSMNEDGNLQVGKTSVAERITAYPALGEVTSEGFSNVIMDADDGLVRNSFLYYDEENGGITYSLSGAVYNEYAHLKGITPEFPEGTVFSFKYSGNAGEYENISLSDVLDGNVPAEAFDDNIVLVGVCTAGMADTYFAPVDSSHKMYSVEVHANAVQALLEQKFIYEIPLWATAGISALLTGILAYICGKLSVVNVIIVCASAALLKFGFGYMIFSGSGRSGDIVVFPVICLAVMVFNILTHYFSANRTKREVENALRKYVAPQVVSDIAKSGSFRLELGGETREVAVLFVDMRGFTALSEALAASAVVEILNAYLELTTDCIFKYGGTLDKFIGDAAMAVFNAPFDTEDYVYKAVLTAFDIIKGGEGLNKRFKDKYNVDIGFGAGVNCGSAIVGNIGCDFRMDYTAVGDTVNVAARLESKAPAGQIYISRAAYEQVRKRVIAEEIGEISLKGKAKGVFVYNVRGIKENAEK